MSLSLVYPCAPLDSVAVSVQEGFLRGIRPVLLDDGTGGVYACRSIQHRFIGIFKPCDEEPGARYNPKNYGNLVRKGIPLCQMAIRECMAYHVDVNHYAQVPPTCLSYGKHESFHSNKKKLGSFQLYCPHDCSAEDLGPSMYSTDQVHAIACLDIRLFNQDRHAGNLLVQRNSDSRSNLIPIDHGCCLPDLNHLEETTFAWMNWPQAKIPLSSATKAYVASLDSFAQEKSMKHLRPPPKALVTLHVGTLLLKKCVAMGLTVYDIGVLLVRSNLSTPSPIEGIIKSLKHLDAESHIQIFLRIFEVALDKLLRRMISPARSASIVREWTHSQYPPRKSYAKVLLSSAA